MIDPVLTYSAVFGGSGFESLMNGLELDVGRGIAVDSSGNAYIVGTAYSQDFSALNSTIAQRHGVPVIENPPLARALYRGAAVGQEIPRELYRLVAEVLAYVYSLRTAGR